MSSATVSSAQTPSFYSMNGTLSLNGTEFASGLDTQSLIKALTANISSQIDKEKQLEQKAEWKRDAFRAVEDLLQKFSDTYFSYSTNSPLNIMSRDFFDSEDLISSNSSIVSATGAQSDAGNVVIDKISQLATAATYTSGQVSNESINSTEALGSTISAGSYLNLNVNGKTYTLSLGANIDTKTQLPDGSWTNKDVSTVASDIVTQLNTQATALNKSIKDATDQDGKVAFAIGSNGDINLTGATVTGASANLGKGLGIAREANGVTTYDMTHMQVKDSSIANLTSLDDQLAGTTLTVQLDGLSKTISFDSGFTNNFPTNGDLATQQSYMKNYLQSQMDAAFGKDSSNNSKVNVTMSGGKLSFTTPTDSSSVLQFTSSSSNGVLGYDGLLHIRSGETNRLELDKTLDELNTSSELGTGLTNHTFTKDGKTIDGYEFVVNGKEFAFDKNTELNTVINTINDDTTANVTISYSQTLNRFRIVSDDTGAQGSVSIHDENGNFTAALFGSGCEPTVTSKSIGTVADGNYSYNFDLGDGTSQAINFAINNTNDQSLTTLKTAIQTAIDASTPLHGKVTVDISGDKLTFQTTQPTNGTSPTLKITPGSASKDISMVGSQFTDGNYSYDFDLGDGTPHEINFTIDTSNDQSLTNLQNTIQSAITAGGLNGKVTVGASGNNNLTFQSTDGTALKITTGDILGVGTSGTASISGLTTGKDLSMSVELGGTKQDITRSTNSFTLDGVTLHVTGQTKDGDSPITFSASNNTDDLYKKISDFVDQYNAIVDKINTDVATMPATQSTSNGGGTDYEPLTDDQKKTMTDTEITDWNTKAQQGLLFCDPQMSALQTDIRTAMEGNVDSVGMSLASIGIATAPLDTTSGGKLIISTDKLKDMLKSDPDKVAQLFTNADGIASRIKNVIKKNIGEFGNDGALFDVAGSSTMIGADTSQIGSEITDYDKNIKDLQTQLKDQQDSLQTKFTNMEMIISQLSSQYNYMSSMSSS